MGIIYRTSQDTGYTFLSSGIICMIAPFAAVPPQRTPVRRQARTWGTASNVTPVATLIQSRVTIRVFFQMCSSSANLLSTWGFAFLNIARSIRVDRCPERAMLYWAYEPVPVYKTSRRRVTNNKFGVLCAAEHTGFEVGNKLPTGMLVKVRASRVADDMCKWRP